jgi:hypothetical protein
MMLPKSLPLLTKFNTVPSNPVYYYQDYQNPFKYYQNLSDTIEHLALYYQYPTEYYQVFLGITKSCLELLKPCQMLWIPSLILPKSWKVLTKSYMI